MAIQVDKINYDAYDNFIFDLYGTLIDLHTDERCAKTWRKWMKWLDGRGIRHPWYPFFRHRFFRMDADLRRKVLARGQVTCPEIDVLDIYRDLFGRYGNRLDEAAIEEASYAFRCASMDYKRLYPGAKAYLEMLRSKGKKIYILSNAQASYTRPEILHFGLDRLVDGYYMSSDFGCMKPDGRYYDVLIGDQGLDPGRSIMIGDNPDSDIYGANQAGMDAYQICHGNLFRDDAIIL